MPAAEQRIIRVTAGSQAEAVMVRPALSTEPNNWITVPAGKVLRLTGGLTLSRVPLQLGPTIIRARKGQTVAGEEIARSVIRQNETDAGNNATPMRIDGGAAGQDIVFTVEQPGSQAGGAAALVLVGHRD
jgi:hypothetical protein